MSAPPAPPPRSGLLAGRRILVTGVLTPASLATGIAARAAQEGAVVVLSSFGRARRLTERTARRLPGVPPVIELDVTSAADLTALPARVRAHVDSLDGVIHAVAFAPPAALGDTLTAASWPEAAAALEVSAFSLASLLGALSPVLAGGASVVGLTFGPGQTWPGYGWMGVAKAALEATARGLARELGPQRVRVNLIAAGPVRTLAAAAVPGFASVEQHWGARAPLGWDIHDSGPVASAAVALLSDLFPATTGEVIHVDGGAHACGG